MKYLISIIFQLFIFTALFLSSPVFSKLNWGILGFFLLIIVLLSISVSTNIALFKPKRKMLFSILLFPIILFISFTISVNLSMQFGFSGRSFEFSLDSFPPNSKPHENNCTHIVGINYEYRKAFWEKGDIHDLTITINNKADKNLFQDKKRIKAKFCNRKISWSTFDTCDIYVFDAPIWSKTPIDTLPIVKMKLKYDSLSEKFVKLTEKWNSQIIVK